MAHVIVVGAGLGGISAAVRLAGAGHRVTLLEKNSRPGGKLNLVEHEGFRFDTGPSLVTLPGVISDTFKAAGRRMENYLTLVPLEPLTRYRWPDGSEMDMSSNLPRLTSAVGSISPGDVTGLFKFLAYARNLFERAGPVFLFKERPGFKSLVTRRAPDALRIDAHLTMHRAVKRFFKDDRLVQLFDRYATYNGSSPFKAPATLCMIPYIELVGGGWYIEGGLYRLVEALLDVARELGVNIQTNCEVSEIMIGPKLGLGLGPQGKATGVRIAGGSTIFGDAVVVNADPMYAYSSIVPEEFQDRGVKRRMEKLEPSGSGFVLLLGVKGDYPGLAHHNIFFGPDYRAEFEHIFKLREPAPDPTIYVACTSKSDPTQAPPGYLNLFVLVNAPALTPEADWQRWQGPYRDAIISTLERTAMPGLSERIVYEQVLTPEDFERKYNSWHGSIYGLSSNSRQTAFRRPPNRAPGVRNLFFVGGSVHPGGGIPLVMLSARLVAGMVRS